MAITEKSINKEISKAANLCQEALEISKSEGRNLKLIQAQEAIRTALSYTPNVCWVCGKEFYTKRSDAKTCGATCRMRMKRARG